MRDLPQIIDCDKDQLAYALANALKERDEAREAFREMWQSGDAFLPYVDPETTNRWRKAAGWEETKCKLLDIEYDKLKS